MHRTADSLTVRKEFALRALPKDRLYDLLAKARLIGKWEADALAEAKRRIEVEDDIPPEGWEMRQRAGNRYIPDTREAFGRLIEAGMPEDVLLGTLFFKLTRLEEAYCRLARNGEEKPLAEIKKEFAALTQGIVARGEATYSLVQKKESAS